MAGWVGCAGLPSVHSRQAWALAASKVKGLPSLCCPTISIFDVRVFRLMVSLHFVPGPSAFIAVTRRMPTYTAVLKVALLACHQKYMLCMMLAAAALLREGGGAQGQQSQALQARLWLPRNRAVTPKRGSRMARRRCVRKALDGVAYISADEGGATLCSASGWGKGARRLKAGPTSLGRSEVGARLVSTEDTTQRERASLGNAGCLHKRREPRCFAVCRAGLS